MKNRNYVKTIFEKSLYCLTSEEHSNNRSNIEVVQNMLDGGVRIIQYREKNKSMIEKYKECQKIRELTKKYDAKLIVNDNIDLAIMVDADGVHIGQDDLPINEVRRIVGDDMIIGMSTHNELQARNALNSDADYIGVGPIFKTYTKKDVCDAVGFDYLDYVVKNIDMPFVAIGGIKKDNICEVLNHKAICVAMVTEIVGSDDIKWASKFFINHIKNYKL